MHTDKCILLADVNIDFCDNLCTIIISKNLSTMIISSLRKIYGIDICIFF